MQTFIGKRLSDYSYSVINDSNFIVNLFDDNDTLKDLIIKLRNSISHPTHTMIESQFPSSGYSTIVGKSGLI